MSGEVATINPQQLAPAAPITPQDMLATAVARGDVALAEKLMDLHERWEARRARKAFDTAIASAKAEIPVIYKNREMNAGSGRTSYRYEDMAAIASVVDPILSRHGLGYRFRTNAEPELVTVTCIVFHADGHSEENTLSGRPDTSGSKNAIQSLGSALTYLERYALKAALGIASSSDNDGRGLNGNGSQQVQSQPNADDGERITKGQAAELRNLMEWKKVPEARFLQWAKVPSVDDIAPAFFASCKHAIENYQGPRT